MLAFLFHSPLTVTLNHWHHNLLVDTVAIAKDEEYIGGAQRVVGLNARYSYGDDSAMFLFLLTDKHPGIVYSLVDILLWHSVGVVMACYEDIGTSGKQTVVECFCHLSGLVVVDFSSTGCHK